MKLDRRGRQSRDRLDIEGRIPPELLALFNSATGVVTVEFAGFVVQEIPVESFGRRNRWWDKRWFFVGGRRAPDIQRFDIREDGRFKIQARNLSFDLRGVDLTGPVNFSISFGPDRGETEIQLDSRGRLQKKKSERGRSEESERLEKSEKSGKSGKSGIFGRFRR